MDTGFPRLKKVLRWAQLASFVLFGVVAGFEFFNLILRVGGPPPASILTMARSSALLAPLGWIFWKRNILPRKGTMPDSKRSAQNKDQKSKTKINNCRNEASSQTHFRLVDQWVGERSCSGLPVLTTNTNQPSPPPHSRASTNQPSQSDWGPIKQPATCSLTGASCPPFARPDSLVIQSRLLVHEQAARPKLNNNVSLLGSPPSQERKQQSERAWRGA